MKKIEYILVGQTDKATTFFEELAAKVNELVDVHNESVEKKCTDYACCMNYGKWTHYCGKKENETCQPTTPEKKCVCGEQEILGGAEVEIAGVCHRPNNPCYIIEEKLPTSSYEVTCGRCEKRNDVY